MLPHRFFGASTMNLAMTITTTLRRLLDLVLLALILTVLASLVVARVVPALTGGPTYVVGGGSMEPTIPIGSVVVDVPASPSDVAVGNIVSIEVGPQRAVFTHRIVRTIDRNGVLWIETRGDANPTPDPSIIPASDITGRVATWIPYLGYPIQLMSSLVGVVFLLSVGMVTLVGAWLLESLEEDQRAWAYRRRLALVDAVPIDNSAEGAPG
jgi:signal peptidase